MDGKDAVFKGRREMKKKSHAVVRGHYFLLTFLSLMMIMFGTEFASSRIGQGPLYSYLQEGGQPSSDQEADPGNMLSDADMLLSGGSAPGTEGQGQITRAEKIALSLLGQETTGRVFGRSNGVLAGIANNFTSGRLFPKVLQAINSMGSADSVLQALPVLGALLVYILVFIFVKNVYSAVLRRIFLEARTYESVAYGDVLFFLSVKKWIRASRTMLLKTIYLSLWYLTLVGGLIKELSYFAVPYITAENPSIPAREAITLSRRMMDGHKWELAKFKLTLLGWDILGMVTFGVSEVLYGVSYQIACETEFYARIREIAIERELEGTRYLNDTFLYEKADRILLYETYFEVIDGITILHENRLTLKGWKKWAAEWLGVWLGSTKEKRAYDEQEGRLYVIGEYKKSMDGKAYPARLNPLRLQAGKEEKPLAVTFMRSYTVWMLLLLFFIFCFVGWSWEVTLHFIKFGQLVNRGTLHGPWLPIYGSGGIVALVCCARFRKNPVLEFLTATLLCGIIEYTAALGLELKYHQKWWSYDGYFLNLHGRICAEGLLVFGIACCAVVYVLAPLFDHLLSRFKPRVQIAAAVILSGFYVTDQVYSSRHPNMAEGAIEAPQTEEAATEESPGRTAAEPETGGRTVEETAPGEQE